MNAVLMSLAIPIILLIMYVEYLVLKKQKRNTYTYAETVSNISIGAIERLLNIWFAGLTYYWFDFVYTNYSIWSFDSTWYTWVLLLLATDFIWYWYHRFGHTINIFWAFHIVHHQSESFNLSTAARITILQSFIRTAFWSALPLLGFDPLMIATILVIHGAYSFLTHTEVVNKLGVLEYVFITPSHHRVHHASNEKYLDKNYGDLFVFWDKIFGTFQVEEEKPVYGLTKPLKSHSFLWQHFHYLVELYVRIERETKIWNKISVLLSTPDSLDGTEREEAERIFLQKKSNITLLSKTIRWYVTIQLVLILSVIVSLPFYYQEISLFNYLFIISLICITLINCGALLELKSWVLVIEYVRLVFFTFYLLLTSKYIVFVFIISILITLCVNYNEFKKWYHKKILRIGEDEILNNKI